MAFVKCPRCELNYMLDTEKYCSVCSREMKGEQKDEPFEMCPVCGENPVLPGKEVCLFCLKEMGKAAPDKQAPVVEEDDDEVAPDESALEMEDTSNMDEITLDLSADDIPQTEYGEISRELSLQQTIEEEEEEALAADDDEEDEDQ